MCGSFSSSKAKTSQYTIRSRKASVLEHKASNEASRFVSHSGQGSNSAGSAPAPARLHSDGIYRRLLPSSPFPFLLRPARRPQQRRGTRGATGNDRTRELRTSRCPTQEAGPSRQPTPPASQPLRRARGDAGRPLGHSALAPSARSSSATPTPPDHPRPPNSPAAAAAATIKSGPPPPPAGVMAARGQWPAPGGAAGGSLRLPGPSLTARAAAARAADVTAGC